MARGPTMSLTSIGINFPPQFTRWAEHEVYCIDSIKNQIEHLYSNQRNLFINLTWFGPQFDNSGWQDYQKLVTANVRFDILFLLCTVDPPMITSQQIADIAASLNVSTVVKIGNFETNYEFNFCAAFCADEFKKYTDEELSLSEVKHLYVNYNRKPRTHRVDFVNKLIENDLLKYGVVTLGKSNQVYSTTEGVYLSIGEKNADYVEQGHWFGEDEFGIPHDLFSLHNMDIWKHHFLNIVGETEFNPWDEIFVTEKTWKPIIGLRPFLINGNTKTYKWLRNRGFKTFNHYFDIQLENIPEYQTHDSIVQVIKSLVKLEPAEILQIYNDMLADLQYNKKRFYEFAKEQRTLIDNVLCQNNLTKQTYSINAE
jgi:hypothetical protein